MDGRVGLPQGTLLDGSYRIERVIGSGGFGITYEAEDVKLGTKVAIKEYCPEEFGYRDASLSVRPKSEQHTRTFEWGRSSFLQEARTLARFRHPSVVQVTRVFEAFSTAYMVMVFEQGQSFEERLKRLGGPPTQEELDRIAGPILDALEMMHGESFLHRDIAPDNIIVRADGTPVLLDFGAARRAVAEESRSLTGIVKAGYSPPEQYATDGRLQGPWTDIYAFGATLYRAVTGKAPEESTLRAIDDRMLPAVSVGEGKYRPGFLEAIDACLEVHHADRPQSVAQVRSMLLAQPAREIPPPTHVVAAPPIEMRKIGDVLRAEGDLPGALEAYRASLAIAESLAKADPENAGRQGDLSVSQERIGDALRAQGDLSGALEAYRASLAIAESLAKADPGNAGWQRDLSVSQERIGDVLRSQGDLPGALEAYRASLAIAERLAKADPGNARWQRDLSVSQERIGDALRAQGDLPGALEAYRASLAIAESLAKGDPRNAGWQRDLSVSQERIGDVLRAQGDLPGALEVYRASLAIAEHLAKADPGNAGRQRDLSVAQERIGKLLRALGNSEEVKKAFRVPPARPSMNAWWVIFLGAVVAVVGGVAGGLQYTRWDAKEQGRVAAEATRKADHDAQRQANSAASVKKAEEEAQVRARANAEAKRKAEEEAKREGWKPPLDRVLTAEEEPRIAPGQEFQECKECPRMIVVPAGDFTMGSPSDEAERNSDEGPQHKVTIAKRFAVGKFEVTFTEWDACVAAGGCKYNRDDQGWGRGTRPLINVSWNEAKEYVSWLAKRTGTLYRLLSEAEWEYAARAGTVTAFSTGRTITTDQANFDGNATHDGSSKGVSRGKTVDVGSLNKPNAFGLHDMHGNVWEWVEDCYQDSYDGAPTDGSAKSSAGCSLRVLRGGSWSNFPWNLRSAARSKRYLLGRGNYDGFRVARTISAELNQGRLSEAAEAWAALKDTTSIPALEAYIARFPDTSYADLARTRIAELKKQVAPSINVSNDLAALNRRISELYSAGKYGEAIPLAEKSLELTRNQSGQDHVATAARMDWLAVLYRAQGRYAEAEPLFTRSLAISEMAMGPDHSNVGASLNNLALLYELQGRYTQAEPLHKRALAIREKALGPDHPDVGQSLNNLAVLYRAQGRYAEAEPLHKRALAIAEKALGPDHLDVGTHLNNLAELYRVQGRTAEAEPLHKRALAIREKALGPDHPDVGQSLNNLAVLYRAQGRYAEAEPLQKRALAIAEKALGPDHLDVGTRLNNLAELYRSQGRSAEAEPLQKRALAIAEKALGPDHPSVGVCLNNLAFLYRSQGRTAEAEPLFTRSLAIFEKALGPDHPSVGTSLNNLVELYRGQGRSAEAEPLHKRALAIEEKARARQR